MQLHIQRAYKCTYARCERLALGDLTALTDWRTAPMAGSDRPLIAGVISTTAPSCPSWRKSSYSNPSGDCLELSELPDEQIGIRYSQHPDGPTLIFARAQIAALIRSAKDGEFNKRAGCALPASGR
jgi:hypothetical protein